jgi:hypothetical protein
MKTKKADFVDAQYMSQQYPETFMVPTSDELNSLKVGDLVKLCCCRERFWVEIVKLGDSILGRIDNNLIFSDEHNLEYNDLICFTKRNVLQII